GSTAVVAPVPGGRLRHAALRSVRECRRQLHGGLMPDPASAADATTTGGFLLVLAIVVPLAAALVAFAAGGRHVERISLATIPLRLPIVPPIPIPIHHPAPPPP